MDRVRMSCNEYVLTGKRLRLSLYAINRYLWKTMTLWNGQITFWTVFGNNPKNALKDACIDRPEQPLTKWNSGILCGMDKEIILFRILCWEGP